MLLWAAAWVLEFVMGLWPLNLFLYPFYFVVAEALFHFHTKKYLREQSASPHQTRVDDADTAAVLAFWTWILGSGENDAPALEALLRGWFLHDDGTAASEAEVRRGNLAAFVAWTLYNCDEPEELSAERRATINRIVDDVEVALGRTLPPGRDPTLRTMTYTVGDLEPCYKPLLYYLALQTVHAAVHAVLRLRGFRWRRAGRLRYLVRPACASLQRPPPPPPPPLVLMHGVGGLLPYLGLLWRMADHHDGAVLVPYFGVCAIAAPPAVRRAAAAAPLPTAELVAAIEAMVIRHAAPGGPPRAAFLAHSLGTAFLASVVKGAPASVGAAAFVDPICFLLHHPAVVHNFLYRPASCPPAPLRRAASANADAFPVELKRQPTWEHSPPRGKRRHAPALAAPSVGRHLVHACMRLLVTTEPTIQACFRRAFWWSQHWLHPAELPCGTLVHLSASDTVAEAAPVYEFLRAWRRRRRHSGGSAAARPTLEVEMHDGWHHGWLCLVPAAQRRLIARLQRLLAASRPLKEWPGLGGTNATAADWSVGGSGIAGGAATKAEAAAVARLREEETATSLFSDTSSAHGDGEASDASEHFVYTPGALG